jgi:heme oxygenase
MPSRAKELKAATSTAHDRVDRRIRASAPFANRERYGRFLLVQHAFHSEIDGLYSDTRLAGVLPGLAARRRLPLIEQDLADLGLAPPSAAAAPRLTASSDLPAALGWLYVSEGSNLGAAFLLKEAAALGLSETFGARHLAPAPEGRGAAWRDFTAALDAVDLSAADEAHAIAGATAAFAHVMKLVDAFMPADATIAGSPQAR